MRARLHTLSWSSTVRRRFAGFLLTLIAAGLTPALIASAAAATTPSVRLFGVDYVDARDFGRRFGLTQTWTAPKKEVRLKSRWTTIDLSEHSVEAQLNGVRLFLSEPVVVSNGRLYLSRGDVDHLFTPILVPTSIRATPLRTIVIDAGHGGSDPGNQNRRMKLDEKVFTLDVARRLQRLLKAEGYRVVMTRTTDRSVGLDARAAIARKARADLFISIHFNAFKQAGVAGAETYVMTPRGQRSTPQAERDPKMAKTSFPSNRHDRQNALLGYQLHRSLVKTLGAQDRGLKRFRYSVLRAVPCPAVLVEAAFLSNAAEARKVATPAHRQKIAAAIAAGVKLHADALKRSSAKSR